MIKVALEALSKQPRITDTRESNYRFHVTKEGVILCDSIIQQCCKAKYLRLAHRTHLKTSGRLEGIEDLVPNDDDPNFDLLAQQVRAAMEDGRPHLGLDRLHTFTIRYIRNLYLRHFERPASKSATANSLLGEVANDLRSKGVTSKMATEILKSSARVLDEFNYVRNNQTLAHDNAELVGESEAYFLYQSIAATIRFLKSLNL